MNKTNTKKALTIMFAGMAAVDFAVGMIFITDAVKLGSFRGGKEVYGTVYNYDIRHSTGSKGYICFLNCRYVDERGHNYFTDVQYNFTWQSREKAESIGKAHLDKTVKMFIKSGSCITETEMKRYPVFLSLSIVMPCVAAILLVVPITVMYGRKRSAVDKAVDNDEDYLI